MGSPRGAVHATPARVDRANSTPETEIPERDQRDKQRLSMNRPTNPTLAPKVTRGGFTLLELMISIALVLILILGVNTVFSLTSQTVSAGNALGDIYRKDASFHGVIYQDLKTMVIGSDAPCFVIQNQRRNAFRNAADRDADKDGDVTTYDVNGDGVEDTTTETVSNFTFNHRNHRIDKMCFFARGKFFRQTGSGTNFWDADAFNPNVPQSSPEAWIKYGFLALPDNAGTPMQPNQFGSTPASNPNNYYSTQWILGRHTILLTPTVPPGSQAYLPNDQAAPTSRQWLRPIVFDAVSPDGQLMQATRYDVALTTMANYRERIRTYVSSAAQDGYWHAHGDFYFRGNHLLTRPLTNESVARALPSFVPGCSQFMVEYAGDFLSQNADGSIVNGSIREAAPTQFQQLVFESDSDGVTDFVIGPDGVKKTRWYGLARDMNGDGAINANIDVVPLKDVANFQNRTAPWERLIPSAQDGRYIVGWGADAATASQPRPTMLRITLTIDDPSSRVGGGETFEYVGAVK
jgi:prepilin-type N-terminal cleavage/methylation domain-containing protein